MSKYDALIERKAEGAQFMVDEITHICRNLPKRGPGSEGEKAASEYMAGVLKDKCGCETTYIGGIFAVLVRAGSRRRFGSFGICDNDRAIYFL